MKDSVYLQKYLQGLDNSKYMDHNMEGNKSFHSKAGAEGVVYAHPGSFRQWKRKVKRMQRAEMRRINKRS